MSVARTSDCSSISPVTWPGEEGGSLTVIV